MEKLNIIKINETEVLLQNYEHGRGKIIVSDLYNGSYSYFWGSMSKSLEDFLMSINAGYFAGCLCRDKYKFSGKETAKNIRKYIKTEMSNEFPWYKHFNAQKQLREVLKDIERCDNQNDALYEIESIYKKVDDFDNADYDESRRLENYIKDHFNNEPWYFLDTEPSDDYIFLLRLHKDLVKQLKKKK
jgi:hypothetical protein